MILETDPEINGAKRQEMVKLAAMKIREDARKMALSKVGQENQVAKDTTVKTSSPMKLDKPKNTTKAIVSNDGNSPVKTQTSTQVSVPSPSTPPGPPPSDGDSKKIQIVSNK